ncbi:hypothetical protein BF49_1615 [Bradyrhizobium sp.]|nr:hypothetical protein BF49_1615 [Bradyrhizobium sp.]
MAIIKISSWLTGCKRAGGTVTARAGPGVPLRHETASKHAFGFTPRFP